MGYFSGLGKTVFVMAQGILGAFGVRIPVSFFMSRLPNVRLFYIGLATTCTTVEQGVARPSCRSSSALPTTRTSAAGKKQAPRSESRTKNLR